MKELTFKISAKESTGYIAEIKNYFSAYDRGTNIYTGNYTADWLLSDVFSDEWIIKTETTVQNQDGTYRNTLSRKWNRILPDGSRLTDNNNKKFKEFLQKICFIGIESPICKGDSAISTIAGKGNVVNRIISWVYLNKEIIKPNTHFLKNITQKKLENMIISVCNGGLSGLLCTGQKIIRTYNKYSKNKITSSDIFQLKDDECQYFIEYLERNGAYKLNSLGLNVVDRKAASKLFNITQEELLSTKMKCFLRQFEPDIIKYNDNVLMPINWYTEFPSHLTPLIKDIPHKKQSIGDINQYITCFESWIRLSQIFPNQLPNANTIRFNKLRKIGTENSSDLNLTPWIPLSISLELLNKSIGLILKFGQPITDYYEKCTLHFYKNKITSKNDSNIRNQYTLKNIPPILKELNISGYGINHPQNDDSNVSRFDRMRKNPDLTQLMYILHGACILIIAGLKPMRINELSKLKYDCLYFKKNDGYWIEHEIEKGGIQNILPLDTKPIPSISSKAIYLIKRFNDITQSVTKTNNNILSKYLFYGLPLRACFSMKANVLDSDAIKRRIEKFTDFINIPTDKYGRRWYANIHELRKSFLLTFFWTYKHSSLDSCRWLAGHSDPEHVLNYIQANMPGEEMADIESEYAYNQLRLFNADYSLTEMENISTLNQDVCDHFGVSKTTEIPEKELNDWLVLALQKGKYIIEAINIESTDDIFNARIAIIVKDICI